jgi:hypothetical protein
LEIGFGDASPLVTIAEILDVVLDTKKTTHARKSEPQKNTKTGPAMAAFRATGTHSDNF